MCTHGNRLDLWLPALAALPCCHSLRLMPHSDDSPDLGSATHFDEMAVSSGLAASLSLQLLCCNNFTLPMMAAERTARGLPPVVTGLAAANEWRSLELREAAVETPAARLEQCAMLPSPQIDTTPSYLTHRCQTRAALILAKAERDSTSDSDNGFYLESSSESDNHDWTPGSSCAGDAGNDSASDDDTDSESMDD